MIEEKKGSLTEPTKSMRSSNFELLRIFAMICIVCFHCAFEGGFSYPAFCFNEFVVESFHMLGELGVNLFVLISGYHMIFGKFKWNKFWLLLLEVQFYNWICVFLRYYFGTIELDARTVLINFFPVTESRYWFITTYLLLYLFSPYINKLLHALSKKEFQKLLLTCLIVFSAYPTVFGALKNDTETILYYNRLIWLVVVYMIGAYIRLYPPVKLIRKRQWLLLSAFWFCLLEVSIIIIERFPAFFAKVGITEGNYLWRPNTLPIIALSISVFLFFRLLTIPSSKVINRIASATLGIYLLQDGQLNFYMWQILLKSTEYTYSPRLILYIPSCALFVFLVCLAAELLRQFAVYLGRALFVKITGS